MRASSIRRHLLTLLLLTLAGTWLASAALTYRDAHRGIDALLDAHLAQAARLLVAQAGHELEELDFDEDSDTRPDFRTKVAFQVREADGTLILRSANAPTTPFAGSASGFSEAALGDIRWRVYSAADAEQDVVVHVAEDHATRERIARRVALSALVPQLIALPVLGFAIWWVVGRSLRPLRRLADELAHRSPDDVRPLAAGPMPVELASLAERLEELLLRVRDSLDSERRFTSHAAHELRTPVAALRAQAEVALGHQGLCCSGRGTAPLHRGLRPDDTPRDAADATCPCGRSRSHCKCRHRANCVRLQNECWRRARRPRCRMGRR